MSDSGLQKYIADLKAKNIPEAAIKTRLLQSGWTQQDVDKAFTAGLPDTELPPPPVPHFSMWITFEYILVFISMYVSFTSLGGILHYAVDKNIPDSLDQTTYSYGYMLNDYLLTGYLASIIVTFPIFAILFLILRRQSVEKPAIKNIRSRKILIYFTLVVTFIYMIFHLITTVFQFLQGTSTARSLLHLGVNLLVAGSIFFYLLFEVRSDRKNQ
jgi:hypothetical protein